MTQEQAERFVACLVELIDKRIPSSKPSDPDDSVGNYIHTGDLEETLTNLLTEQQ